MANSFTYQILEDGPRNHVIKVVGILDTADVLLSASPITAAITNGSPIVTYATTAALVVKMRITGTGIPANSYIISINAGVSFTINNNATVTNALASLTPGGAVLFDPSALSKVDDWGTGLATQGRIDRAVFTVENPLECRLYWDATAPSIITDISGAAHQEFYKFGGLQNDAGAGKNGMILLATQGWSTSAILSFNLVLEIVKQK